MYIILWQPTKPEDDKTKKKNRKKASSSEHTEVGRSSRKNLGFEGFNDSNTLQVHISIRATVQLITRFLDATFIVQLRLAQTAAELVCKGLRIILSWGFGDGFMFD